MATPPVAAPPPRSGKLISSMMMGRGRTPGNLRVEDYVPLSESGEEDSAGSPRPASRRALSCPPIDESAAAVRPRPGMRPSSPTRSVRFMSSFWTRRQAPEDLQERLKERVERFASEGRDGSPSTEERLPVGQRRRDVSPPPTGACNGSSGVVHPGPKEAAAPRLASGGARPSSGRRPADLTKLTALSNRYRDEAAARAGAPGDGGRPQQRPQEPQSPAGGVTPQEPQRPAVAPTLLQGVQDRSGGPQDASRRCSSEPPEQPARSSSLGLWGRSKKKEKYEKPAPPQRLLRECLRDLEQLRESAPGYRGPHSRSP